MQKLDRLKGELHLLQTEEKLNKHTIFVETEDQLNNFKVEEHFNTTKDLADNLLLDISPQALTKPISLNTDAATVKGKYSKMADYVERNRKLTKLLLKIGKEKAILGPERSKIKKNKGKKIHKFFIERKK